MPKYYVRCIDIRQVLDARNELDACCLVCWNSGVTTVNVPWVVSERGFEKHEDDVMISDYDIIQEYLKRFM